MNINLGELVRKAGCIKPEEKVIILVENTVLNEGTVSIFKYLNNLVKDVSLIVYPERKKHEETFSDNIKNFLQGADVIIDCSLHTDLYTEFKQRLNSGCRIIYLIKPKTDFIKSFIVNEKKIKQITDKTLELMNFLKNSRKISIKTKNTFLEAGLTSEKPVLADGLPINKRGTNTLLPMASVSFAPIEESVNGKLNFEGVAETVKGNPLKIKTSVSGEIENGIISFDEKCKELRSIFKNSDKEARLIGHITFGSNPFINNIFNEGFLTERKLGGLCLGFGNSQGSLGGSNKSKSHIDISSLFQKIELKNEKGEQFLIEQEDGHNGDFSQKNE